MYSLLLALIYIAFISLGLPDSLFGALGRQFGFEMMPVYLIIFVGLMMIMTELTFRTTTKAKKQEAQK